MTSCLYRQHNACCSLHGGPPNGEGGREICGCEIEDRSHGNHQASVTDSGEGGLNDDLMLDTLWDHFRRLLFCHYLPPFISSLLLH